MIGIEWIAGGALMGGFVISAIYFSGPKKCDAIAFTKEQINSPAEFRIVPLQCGGFQLEEFKYPKYGCSNYKHWEPFEREYIDYKNGCSEFKYEGSYYKTEKEAEAVVYKIMQTRVKNEEAKRIAEEFKKNNPPRDVPPFKFKHGDQ